MSQRNHGILRIAFAVALTGLLGCGGGGSSKGGGNLPQTTAPPTVVLQGWTPNDASLLQYKAYTFNASAADPNAGGSVTEFHWDFGDGTKLVRPAILINGLATDTYTYAYVTSGTPTLSVVSKSSEGFLSSPATRVLTVNSAPSPLTVTFTAPSGPLTINPPLGGTTSVNFDIHVANTGTGTISASGVVLTSGATGSTQAAPVDLGSGNWRIVVTYPAAASLGSQNVTPSVKVLDSNGISSALVTGPVVTIKTVSLIDNPPVITMLATPQIIAGTNSTWQSVPINFIATATDPDGDTLTYSWTFGDTGNQGDVSPTQSATALSQTHTYAVAGVYPVVFTADDGRNVPGVSIKTITLNLVILANSAPTLSILQSPSGVTYANVPLTFTAVVSDADGDTPSIAWDFGDTTTGKDSPIVHSFLAAGSTVVKATADDGKGGVTVKTLALNVLANRPPVSSVTTPAATLYQNKAYTFTALATDPDAGNTISQYQWDFGDGSGVQNSAVATLSHTYASTYTGTAQVRVRAVDNHGSTGDFSQVVLFPVVATPLPVVAFVSPSATTLNVDINGTVTQAFIISATNPRAGSPGVTDPIPVTGITFLPNDAGATITSSVSNGGGSYTFTVRYPGAAAASTRTATPTAYATDTLGIQGQPASGPLMTLKTLGANHAPSITLTSPATDNTVAWTSKPFSLGFTLNDADNDPVVYTINWGDGQPTTSDSPVGDFVAGVPVTVAHTYADAFTASTTGVTITVTATDNRSANSNAVPKTRLVTVKFNALPTATITTPQASGTVPTGLQPGVNPPYVVVPLAGKLTFVGAATLPASQDTVVTTWAFPGGTPSSASGDTPGDIIFSGTQGVITPVTVVYTVTDAFGRTATASKQVLVDGKNTQQFNLSFQYRLKSDNNGTSSLSPVTLAANGLGAQVQIFQDGLSNTYAVQDQVTGGKAQVSIPVRSDLPFYVEIPGFGNDATKYLMRIPNAPTGAYADPALAAPASAGSSTFSFSGAAPWNPTLQIVTAQGFAAESLTAPQRKLNGFTNLVLGLTPVNERWLDRLSVPADDITVAIPWSQSSNSVGQLSGIPAYQLFAEWPTLVLTRKTGDLLESVPDVTPSAGRSTDLGFVLDYTKYSGDSQPSETFATFSMQAFRVPAGVTDPYQLSPAWQSVTAELNSTGADPHAGLNPVQVSGGVPIFFNNLLYTSPGAAPLAGGIQDLPLPYDPNDPNRIPILTPTTRYYSNARQVFSYSEYLWSTVWARPLVLNSARPNYVTTMFSLSTFPYFRYSNPTAWPKASGISPDNSAFDLTVRGGGVFDGSAPVGLAGAAASTTGVGRFFWTAFTPSYQGDANSGAAIARTWLADDSTKQPPTTFAGSVTGDATVALGFITPQDTIVDKRGRNADGSLSGALLGGYRVTWFNPTKDAGSNAVPPDFWVVELKDSNGTKHFMLPGSYPAGSQSLTDLIMTDARLFLPSGNAAATGPATTGGVVTDKIAPGYCWFDIPIELRPTSGATLTVFAVKSILKNNPVATKRPLNRPDWIDAIKTATATMKMLTSSGSDLTYAYKIPFNFDWDIVVASGPQTLVAP